MADAHLQDRGARRAIATIVQRSRIRAICTPPTDEAMNAYGSRQP